VEQGPGARLSDTESREFWGRLARLMNAVLRASPDKDIRFLWVDDVIAPPSLPLQGAASTTTAAFVSENGGKSFVQYGVNLFFTDGAVAAYRGGEWSRLFPQPDATNWFTISRTHKEMQINIVL
jgi:hypothetical protein